MVVTCGESEWRSEREWIGWWVGAGVPEPDAPRRSAETSSRPSNSERPPSQPQPPRSMWPFSTTPTASTSTNADVPPSACPVDHSTREAWLASNPGGSHPSSAPSSSQPPSAASLSAEREVSSIPRWTKDPIPADESSRWVYPSPRSFYNALERKQRAPQAEDMPIVVPIHNAVNERVWDQVLQWEREAGAMEGASKLVSFIGRPKDLSPRARWKTLIG